MITFLNYLFTILLAGAFIASVVFLVKSIIDKDWFYTGIFFFLAFLDFMLTVIGVHFILG